MVNEHEVETADIEVGEQIGWIDRLGHQCYGIVDEHASETLSGAFHVSVGGCIKAVGHSRINWREVY